MARSGKEFKVAKDDVISDGKPNFVTNSLQFDSHIILFKNSEFISTPFPV